MFYVLKVHQVSFFTYFLCPNYIIRFYAVITSAVMFYVLYNNFIKCHVPVCFNYSKCYISTSILHQVSIWYALNTWSVTLFYTPPMSSYPFLYTTYVQLPFCIPQLCPVLLLLFVVVVFVGGFVFVCLLLLLYVFCLFVSFLFVCLCFLCLFFIIYCMKCYIVHCSKSSTEWWFLWILFSVLCLCLKLVTHFLWKSLSGPLNPCNPVRLTGR